MWSSAKYKLFTIMYDREKHGLFIWEAGTRFTHTSHMIAPVSSSTDWLLVKIRQQQLRSLKCHGAGLLGWNMKSVCETTPQDAWIKSDLHWPFLPSDSNWKCGEKPSGWSFAFSVHKKKTKTLNNKNQPNRSVFCPECFGMDSYLPSSC